jgi:hypothetical protein
VSVTSCIQLRTSLLQAKFDRFSRNSAHEIGAGPILVFFKSVLLTIQMILHVAVGTQQVKISNES